MGWNPIFKSSSTHLHFYTANYTANSTYTAKIYLTGAFLRENYNKISHNIILIGIWTALDNNGQDCNVGRIHSWNAACLRKRLRAAFLELLAAFESN